MILRTELPTRRHERSRVLQRLPDGQQLRDHRAERRDRGCEPGALASPFPYHLFPCFAFEIADSVLNRVSFSCSYGRCAVEGTTTAPLCNAAVLGTPISDIARVADADYLAGPSARTTAADSTGRATTRATPAATRTGRTAVTTSCPAATADERTQGWERLGVTAALQTRKEKTYVIHCLRSCIGATLCRLRKRTTELR